MSKKVDFIANKMVARPYIIEMGCGSISRWLECTREEAREAKYIAKNILRGGRVTEIVQEKVRMPKILLLDIETAPVEAYVWGLWQQNVSLDQIISNWFMLTWSAKWLYSPEVMSDAITPEEVLEENDKRIVWSLLKLLDEADVVIAHNGIGFDVPKVNARAVTWGFMPPSPYQQIDTLLIARKQFGFSSNKLEALARMFKIPGKIETNFQLWSDCKKGDQVALAKMEQYNRQDVIVLEEVYLRLRPWVKGHINLGLYGLSDKMICPNCGSTHLEEDGGFYYTGMGRYKTYRCQCGAVSRARTTDVTPEERKKLVISVSR
jgi:hypothetical protein